MPQLGIRNLTASQGRVASCGPLGQVWGCSKARAHVCGRLHQPPLVGQWLHQSQQRARFP